MMGLKTRRVLETDSLARWAGRHAPRHAPPIFQGITNIVLTSSVGLHLISCTNCSRWCQFYELLPIFLKNAGRLQVRSYAIYKRRVPFISLQGQLIHP